MLTGFAFATVEEIVPAGSKALLGKGFDLQTRFYAAPDQLYVRGAMNPIGAAKLPLRVDGTPLAPEIDLKSMALIGSVGVIGGGLLNLSGNLVSGSSEIVGSSVSAVGSVGSGVLDATKSLGLGLFKTTKGLVTLDGDALGDGVKGATAGTVGSAVGGVTDAGGDVAGGVKSSATVRTDKFGRWLDASEQRHDKRRAELTEQLTSGAIMAQAKDYRAHPDDADADGEVRQSSSAAQASSSDHDDDPIFDD